MDWGLAALAAYLACAALFLYAEISDGAGTVVGLGLVVVLSLVALPAIDRLAREEHAFDLRNLILVSLALHFVGAYLRLREAADSLVYHRVGVELAAEFRSLNFAPDLDRGFLGTGFLRYLSGLVHVITFDHRFGAFMIFTFMGFWGVFLLYRAFLIGFPEGDRRRYALLLFLWPSLLFWPSSLGKEAWMLLAIGITALGAARLLSHLPRGLTYTLAGLGATLLVRPHVALLLLGSILVAYLFRSSSGDPLRLVSKIAGVVVLLTVSAVLASQTTEYFNVESLGADAIGQVTEGTVEQTSQGGSSFTPARVRTPLDYPLASVTVVLRPFPLEATSMAMVLTSLESIVLLAILVVGFRRISGLGKLLRRRSYLVFSAAFVITFIWAFSAIGNFGILARQRTQVIPFVLLFAALPAVESIRGRRPVRGVTTAPPASAGGPDPSDSDGASPSRRA